MAKYHGVLRPPTKEFRQWERDTRTAIKEMTGKDDDNVRKHELTTQIADLSKEIATMAEPPEGINASKWPVKVDNTLNYMCNFVPEVTQAKRHTVASTIEILTLRVENLKKYKKQVKHNVEMYGKMILVEEERTDGVCEYDPSVKPRGAITRNLSPFVAAHEAFIKDFPEEKEPCTICGCSGENHTRQAQGGMVPVTGLICENCEQTEAIWQGD
jgi:hypothetical protein